MMKKLAAFLLCFVMLISSSWAATGQDQPGDDGPSFFRGADPKQEGSSSTGKMEPPAPLAPLAVTAPQSSWPGPDGYGYKGETVTYSWVEISGTGTPVLNLTDDDYSDPLNIGFNFPFYGQTYSQFVIESNGYLDLGPYGSLYLSSSCPFPKNFEPYNVIGLLWDDLYPNYTTGGVYYQTFSSCPVGSGQCLVVEYKNWSHYASTIVPGSAGTFEAILYANGEIRLQYQDSGSEMGAFSSTGIEGFNYPGNYGLTVACMASNSLLDNTAYRIYPQTGVHLAPEAPTAAACSGISQPYRFYVANQTSSSSLGLSYQITNGSATIGGPTGGTLYQGEYAEFFVSITPSAGLPAGSQVTGRVTASAGGLTDQVSLVKTINSDGAWNPIATEPYSGRMDNVLATYNNQIWSVTGYGYDNQVVRFNPATNAWTVVGTPPPFSNSYARSGCQHNEKVYIYGDLFYYSGLWSYNLNTGAWVNEAPTGTPPPYSGIWAPAWVHDPETGYCYLTGGATDSGPGDLATVYVYNPAGNTWLSSLPGFTTPRDFHAAFLFRRPADNHKLLCVAGGTKLEGEDSVDLSSTQCYDFSTGSWAVENATLPALPGPWWGMGYAQTTRAGLNRLYLISGIYNASVSDASYFLDVTSGASWKSAGQQSTGRVFRTSAVALNNEVYRMGGSGGGFSPAGYGEHRAECLASTPQPTGYRLSLPLSIYNVPNFFEGPFEVEPNNSFDQANGPIRSGKTYQGYPNDIYDVFSFSAGGAGSVTLDLTNHTGSNVQLQLYGPTRQLIEAILAPPYQKTIAIGGAGTYYVIINTGGGYNSSATYNLKVTYP